MENDILRRKGTKEAEIASSLILGKSMADRRLSIIRIWVFFPERTSTEHYDLA